MVAGAEKVPENLAVGEVTTNFNSDAVKGSSQWLELGFAFSTTTVQRAWDCAESALGNGRMDIKFAQRLKSAREKAGYNQSELARAAGVTRAAISKWEQVGVSDVSAVAISKVATLLGTSIDELMTGKSKMSIDVTVLGIELEKIENVFKDISSQDKAKLLSVCYRLHLDGKTPDGDTLMALRSALR